MSEPYSCFLHTTIDEASLRRFLASPVAPTTAYDDWDRCTGFIDTSDFSPESFREFVASAAYEEGATYGALFAKLRGKAKHPFFRFGYDAASRTLTQTTYLYAQGALELVWHLGITRGIGAFLSAGDRGFCAVHDPFLGNGTVGVVALEAGASRTLGESAFRSYEGSLADVVSELQTNAAAYLAAFELGKKPDPTTTANAVRDALDTYLT